MDAMNKIQIDRIAIKDINLDHALKFLGKDKEEFNSQTENDINKVPDIIALHHKVKNKFDWFFK